MKRILTAAGISLLLGVGCEFQSNYGPDAFKISGVKPEHQHMHALMANALAYIKPSNHVIDPASGYPVEGWNHDSKRALYLRSFTQLTAIGQWIELLANIAAGHADNPYLSRDEALKQLQITLNTLLLDQQDPAVSGKGLLGNFLGFSPSGRVGPLSEEVEKKKFVNAFGAKKADAIWNALIAKKWLIPRQDGSFANIPRKGNYGDRYFTDELEPFSDSKTMRKIMALLDARVVQIIFGDNANLTTSIAKAIGALLHDSLQDNPFVAKLRDQLEQFIDQQEIGYRHLYDKQTGTFLFGWNATKNQFVGWENGAGNWVNGHMDYLINEFRAPLTFVVRRFNLPEDAIKNCGIKIKPYRMTNGSDLYTLATWEGSAFQSLGLSLFMQELQSAGWKENLENAVAINLDYASKHGLPGFLSEAYSGKGVEYTGRIGIADIAVTDQARITDAPSLYTLGVAYEIAPDQIENFVSNNWNTIEQLFTDHGPWEGFNTTQQKAIEFQTTAHTLSLLLGGMGSAEANMQRYVAWKGLPVPENTEEQTAASIDLMNTAEWVSWSGLGDPLEGIREDHRFTLRGNNIRQGAVTIKPAAPINLSNGAFVIRYQAKQPPTRSVLTLDAGHRVFQNEVFLRLDTTETEKQIRIPLPATPGLNGVKELVLLFGGEQQPEQVDFSITHFQFIPGVKH